MMRTVLGVIGSVIVGWCVGFAIGAALVLVLPSGHTPEAATPTTHTVEMTACEDTQAGWCVTLDNIGDGDRYYLSDPQGSFHEPLTECLPVDTAAHCFYWRGDTAYVRVSK